MYLQRPSTLYEEQKPLIPILQMVISMLGVIMMMLKQIMIQRMWRIFTVLSTKNVSSHATGHLKHVCTLLEFYMCTTLQLRLPHYLLHMFLMLTNTKTSNLVRYAVHKIIGKHFCLHVKFCLVIRAYISVVCV